MATDPTIKDLLKRIEELESKLQPQTLRNALERTYDPRGGEPRIIDENGRTLDYTPALQFLGGTTTLDAPNQRIIYTASGGGGSVALRFSDTYPSTSPDEKLEWVAESGAPVDHMIIDTGTIAGIFRLGQIIVAEDTSLFGSAPVGYWQSLVNDSGGTASMSTGADNSSVGGSYSATSDGTTASANAVASNGAHGASMRLASDGGSTATSAMIQATEDGVDVTYVRVEDGLVEIISDPAAYGVDLFTSGEESSFVQIGGSAGAGTPSTTKRMIRGPFEQLIGTVGALATTTTTVLDCRAGTDYVVQGGIRGSAGSEWVVWSYEDSGSNDVLVSVTNTDPINNHTIDFVCNVVSTA